MIQSACCDTTRACGIVKKQRARKAQKMRKLEKALWQQFFTHTQTCLAGFVQECTSHWNGRILHTFSLSNHILKELQNGIFTSLLQALPNVDIYQNDHHFCAIIIVFFIFAHLGTIQFCDIMWLQIKKDDQFCHHAGAAAISYQIANHSNANREIKNY